MTMGRFVSSLLDSWRQVVVPLLWSVFLIGLLIGISQKIDESLRGSYSGLSETARVGISRGLSDHLPGRIAFFDSWASGENASFDGSDFASAAAVVKYFGHDGGARLILGAKKASELIVWSGQITRRFFLWPLLIVSLVVMIGAAAMLSLKDRRRWRAMAYFSSRTFILCSYSVVIMRIVGAFGEVWLMGSAASRLTELPVTVPLWSSMLASGPLISSSAWLVAVFCLSCAVDSIFPDP